MPFFALDGANNKIETLSKEEILTAIENARIGRSLSDYDMAIVSRLREINHNDELRFWIGTQAEYNALDVTENNVLYIISDENYKEELIEAIENLQETTDTLTGIVNEAIEKEAADIENESFLREAADLSLDNKISSTKTELQQNIDNEATARETAVSSEATARRNADTALQANITTAQGNISNLQTRMTEAESDIANLQGRTNTLLFNGNADVNATMTLSEAFTNFKQIMFVNSERAVGTVFVGQEAKASSLTEISGTLFVNGILGFAGMQVSDSVNTVRLYRYSIQALSSTRLKVTASSGINLWGGSGSGGSISDTLKSNIVKIYGINRVNG